MPGTTSATLPGPGSTGVMSPRCSARLNWDQASLAVLDPPRVGVARPALDLLLRPGSALRRVAYVSCDPATLARDIAVFAEAWLAARRAPRVRYVPHDPPRRMRGHLDPGVNAAAGPPVGPGRDPPGLAGLRGWVM